MKVGCPSAKLVVTAAESLVDEGLLLHDASEADRRKPGIQMKKYRKATWDEIQGSPSAKASFERHGFARAHVD